MNILITGATGMIGRALVAHFTNQHTLTFVGRSRDKIIKAFDKPYAVLTWDELKSRGVDYIKTQDIIINLAGENIAAKRWTSQQKQKILNSRIETTTLIANLCAQLGPQSPRLLSANGVGIYGYSKNTTETAFNEHSAIAQSKNSFLATVGVAWDNALQVLENHGVPVVKMRFGAVLSQQGGALAKMLPAFRLGLGAVLGDGTQPFAWVAITDLMRAFDFLIAHPEITGPVNIVSPGEVSQAAFADALAKSLHRPRFLRLPAWFVKVLFGEMGRELLLKGQYVQSEKLLQAGFVFQCADVSEVMQNS